MDPARFHFFDRKTGPRSDRAQRRPSGHEGPEGVGLSSGGVRRRSPTGPLGCPRRGSSERRRRRAPVDPGPTRRTDPGRSDRQARPASPAPRHERAASIARGGRSRPSAPNDAAPTVRHRSARSSARSRIAFRRPASASTSAARSDSSAETARCRSASRPIRVTSVRSAWFCFRRCAIRRASSRCIHVRICARRRDGPRHPSLRARPASTEVARPSCTRGRRRAPSMCRPAPRDKRAVAT